VKKICIEMVIEGMTQRGVREQMIDYLALGAEEDS